MDKHEKETEYVGILDALQRMKNGIVQDCTEELIMTGTMPARAQEELKVLASITGAVFCGFKTLGLPLVQDPEHTGMVQVTIGERTFSCAKANIADTKDISLQQDKDAPTGRREPVVQEKEEAPALVEEEPVLLEEDLSLEEEELPEIVLEEEEFEDVPVSTEEEPAVLKEEEPEIVLEEEEPELVLEEEPEIVLEEEEDFTEEPVSYEENASVEINKEDYEKKAIDLLNQLDEVEEPVQMTENKEEEQSESKEEAAAPVSKAHIIGGGPSVMQTFNMDDMFIEEKNKLGREFIYNYSKISVVHPDMGARPEEMLVLIAPLKVTKYACASVPVVVTIMNRGRTVTASSYDTKDTGKNIVTIDINEFYFLVRGSIDDNGRFKATLVTTGISANQGDKISVISSKTYGDCTARDVRNGHIKFRYQAEAGPGTVEVFPFGEIGDDDFVAIVKNEEFVDYYVLSKALRANQRPIIYMNNGDPAELICHWEGEELQVELMS